MLGTILFLAGFVLLAVQVALGWVPDTAQPVAFWYPAGPDPEPWRTD
jgi:hypothetical protein